MRTLIALALIASTANAATIYSHTPPPDVENYFAIEPAYLDPTWRERTYAYMAIDEEPWGTIGWTDFAVHDADPLPLAVHYLIAPIYVSLADAAVFIRPQAVTATMGIEFDLTEFIDAGDTEIAWTIDVTLNGNGPWNSLVLTSAHLGSVVRTFPVVRVPEPAAWLLLTVGAAFLRRRQ